MGITSTLTRKQSPVRSDARDRVMQINSRIRKGQTIVAQWGTMQQQIVRARSRYGRVEVLTYDKHWREEPDRWYVNTLC